MLRNSAGQIRIVPTVLMWLAVIFVLGGLCLGATLGVRAFSSAFQGTFPPAVDQPEPFSAEPAQALQALADESLKRENAQLESEVSKQAEENEILDAQLEEALKNDDNYPVITEMAELPSNWDAWLDEQIFDQNVNGCDPKSYTANNWWLESTSEDGAKFDGNQGAEYDIVLREVTLANFGQQNESVIVWASSVQVYVYGSDELLYEGNGPVKVTGPGRFLVKIQNGGYRIGVDLGGEFTPYWTEVLTCLYGDNWTPADVK